MARDRTLHIRFRYAAFSPSAMVVVLLFLSLFFFFSSGSDAFPFRPV